MQVCRACASSSTNKPSVVSSAGYTDLPDEIQKAIQKKVNAKLTIGIREYDAKISGDEDGDEGEPIDISWEWHDVTGITCDATGTEFEEESMADYMQDYLQGFQRCHNLQSLDLSDGEFYEDDDSTMQVLYNSMKSWPRLVELHTTYTGGNSASDMGILGKILSENTQLRRLTINSPVSASQLKQLEASLTTSHVKELTINMIHFECNESKVFADILEKSCRSHLFPAAAWSKSCTLLF